jgi:hypothetical protein
MRAGGDGPSTPELGAPAVPNQGLGMNVKTTTTFTRITNEVLERPDAPTVGFGSKPIEGATAKKVGADAYPIVPKPEQVARTVTERRETQTTWELEPFDYIGIASAIIAIMFAFAMVFGAVPINKTTVSIVAFTAVPPALLGVKVARRRNKK